MAKGEELDALKPTTDPISKIEFGRMIEKIDALGARMQEKFSAIEIYFDSRFDSLDKAATIAYANMERRLEAMNEFRDSLRDANVLRDKDSAKFVTHSELESAKDSIGADIRILREYKSLLEGKASQSSVVIAWILSSMGIVVSVVGLFRAFIK